MRGARIAIDAPALYDGLESVHFASMHAAFRANRRGRRPGVPFEALVPFNNAFFVLLRNISYGGRIRRARIVFTGRNK